MCTNAHTWIGLCSVRIIQHAMVAYMSSMTWSRRRPSMRPLPLQAVINEIKVQVRFVIDNSSTASGSSDPLGRSRPKLYSCIGLSNFISCQLYVVTFFLFSACTQPVFLCHTSTVLFPWANVWENIRAWVPYFLEPHWGQLAFFALWKQWKNVDAVSCYSS